MAKRRRQVTVQSAAKYIGQGGGATSFGIDRQALARQVRALREGKNVIYPVDREGQDLNIQTPQEALNHMRSGQLRKNELPGVLYALGLINNPDELAPNEAVRMLVKAIKTGRVHDPDEFEQEVKQAESQAVEVLQGKASHRRQYRKKFASKEEKMAYQRQMREASLQGRKAQYTGENVNTGNGGNAPGNFREEDSTLDMKGKSPERYVQRKKQILVKKDHQTPVQPKSDADGATETKLRSPNHEGLKAAMADIGSSLSQMTVDDLFEIQSSLTGIGKKIQTEELEEATVSVDEPPAYELMTPDELCSALRKGLS